MKLIPFLLLLIFVLAWFLPSVTPMIGIGVLVFSLAVGMVSIFKVQGEAHRQGKLTRNVFVRNIFLEVLGLLLAMILAGLAGRYAAQIATVSIVNDLVKLIAGIVIGLLVGMGVGLLVKRTWGRWVR